MNATFTPEELETVTVVLKEYLTDLRSEILETEDPASRQQLRDKDEVLRVALAKFERERQTVQQFLKA
jgi:hypothetical protein